MSGSSVRAVLELFALLVFTGGTSLLVLAGVGPSQEPTVLLAAIAGLTTVVAARIRAMIPALAAGGITLGCVLGSIGQDAVGIIGRVVVPVAGVITLSCAILFLGSMGWLVGTHLFDAIHS